MSEPKEVLAVLQAIDSGEVTVTLTDVEGCYAEFHASNGWDFIVLDDTGGWDYIDEFRAPGGEWVDVDAEKFEAVLFWSPQDARKTWGWVQDGTSPSGYRV